jgi:penicillin-binding protein 1A
VGVDVVDRIGREFYGPITFRKALAKSVNTAAVHLSDEVGMGEVIRYARRLGIESPIEPTLATALGTNGVSLLELTRGYGVFAAGGRRLVPRYITKVTDRDGNVLLERVTLGTDFESMPPAAEEGEGNGPDAADPMGHPHDAYRWSTAARGGDRGHGPRLREPASARKTGTTNDQADARSSVAGFDQAVGHDVAVSRRDARPPRRSEDYMRVAPGARLLAPDSIAQYDRESDC